MPVQIGTLIIATSLVQLANGFFNTFLSLRLTTENFGPTLTGIILSAYFIGYTLGAVGCGRVLRRIGHIRAYAAFAGMVVIGTSAMPILVSPAGWIVARMAIGVGCVGLFITTESWLSSKAAPEQRGRVFSIYMVGTFLALACGQLLIGLLKVDSALPFNIIAALFALALVLVSGTRAEQPALPGDSSLPYMELVRQAPISVIGVVIAGMVTSAFYALFPAWMATNAIQQETIALFMLVAVLGGFALQVPVGRLSDRGDRRIVLAGLALGYSVAAIALDLVPKSLAAVLPVAALLGGFMSTLYPVCVAHALDRMPQDRVVAVSGHLILIGGIGSAMGPILGAQVMARLDINGLLYFMAAITAALAAITFWRIKARAPAEQMAERPFAIIDPLTAPISQEPEATEADGSPRPLPA